MGLQVNDISKSFGGKRAVDRLSFAVKEPCVFGLIGTNGAGKTTTIRMILGILQPDEGTVTWNDGPVRRDNVRFGYMPEERGIYMKTKVLEQLIYFGRLQGMTKHAAEEAALFWLKRTGTEEYRDMTADKLSKGNQQKIQLITTLLHDPDLIFLDEPFSGLDPVNTDLFRSIIQELRDAGKYIVMSSHQMATVEEYCKELVILSKGQTVLSGNLRSIKAGYGHTNLLVSADGPVDGLAVSLGLRLVEKRANESEYKIASDEMAQQFLAKLLENGIYPTKYEIREPSLHEIFLEKVGANA